MRQILKESSLWMRVESRGLLGVKVGGRFFSTLPHDIGIQKSIQFQFKFRSLVKLSQLNQYIQQNKEDIQKYGKTLILQFLNEFPMQSFRRSRDQINPQKRQEKYKLRQSIYLFMNQLEDLNFYELNLRYSIFKKLINYVGSDPLIIQRADFNQKQLVKILENQSVHIADVMNWLYMLPLNYKQYFSTLAFDLIDKEFQSPQVRQFFQSQRGLPMLIKRISQKDWIKMRQYHNIIRFITNEASTKLFDNLEQLITQLQRLVKLRLHIVGQKKIPKIVDDLMSKFQNEFDDISKNKQAILKVFSVFKYLPLNYNNKFFNKIHTHLKGTKQLPSHLLLYLPYNKLTKSQVSFLQSKMFTIGREDIAVKLIYTIYQPQYKDILTPFMLKESYNNMLEMWKKQDVRLNYHYQVYIALIFRFNKLKTPIIDQGKIKQIFVKIVSKAQENGYSFFQTLSFVGMVTFFQLCNTYKVYINEVFLLKRMENIIKHRKQKNTFSMVLQQFMLALKVHYNANHRKSRYFLTFFINQIYTHSEIQFDQKLQLLFLIGKALRPEPKWVQYSKKLSNQLMKDVDSFIESYIKYEYKSLKLTNFVFSKLQEQKVDFNTAIQLLSNLNLKLVTSFNGKIISPVKKYIDQLDLTLFQINKSSLSSILKAYRILFYFKNQIPQFMELLSIKLTKMVLQKIKQGQCINGKQFASLTPSIMQAVKNIQIQKKTDVVQSIVFILKELSEKQGIHLKVYELDFLCSYQKYIKINNEVLRLQCNEIVDTLKRIQGFQDHKDLFPIIVKLHCRQFIQLSTHVLGNFITKCTEMIDNSMLNLDQMKQYLGYEILSCQDQSQIQKTRQFLSEMVKLCFRRDKTKHSHLIYEYFLHFFSKLNANDMISQICQKLLYQNVHSVQVSNIVSILNKSQIKNSRFTKRILQATILSQNSTSFQSNISIINTDMQVLSWLQKISYELSESDVNLSKLRAKVAEGMLVMIDQLKLQIKNTQNQQWKGQEGQTFQDKNFDRNYRTLVEYAWFSIKNKNIHTEQFKFVCRYVFFGVNKIKARIQNPQQRKLISKIKLYHVIRFIKQSGLFSVDDQKKETSAIGIALLKQKNRKYRVLVKMEKQLSFVQVQTCQKLEKRLDEFEGIFQCKFKHQIKAKQTSNPSISGYYVQQNNQKTNLPIQNKFIIHTVKKYHLTPQTQMGQDSNTRSQVTVQKQNKNKYKNVNDKKEIMLDESIIFPDEDEYVADINTFVDLNSQEGNIVDSSLGYQTYNQLKAEKDKQAKDAKAPKKALFSSANKNKKVANEHKQISKSKKQFETTLPLQKSRQHRYKDYNGYLKVQKSLIELSTGLKCIIYDPEKDIFLD